MAKNKKFDKRNKKNKGNSKPMDRKPETYVDKSDGEETTYKFRNHPSDFIPDEAIRKQVGSFSFNNTIGIPLYIDGNVEGTHYRDAFKVPSVMSIQLYSSIGAIEDVNSIDGINTSGQKYYNLLSSINAKTTNYQPQDISLVEVLISSLLEQVANAMRVYGVAFNFNPRNRNIPNDLISAMGVAPDSLTDNGDLAAYRMRLNRILTAANGIKFLKDLNIFKRSWELFSRIFIDENSSMGQYYIFRPSGYWILDESESETRAHWVERPNVISAFELLDDIEAIVRVLLGSTLFNYIYTDILNYQLKKGGELLSFAYVPELVQVFGVYDPGVLNQIHNMTWGGADTSNYKIIDVVNENRIVTTNPIYSPSTSVALVSCNGTQLLDHVYTDQPTYDDNVDAMAFKSAYYDIYLDEADNLRKATQVFLPDHPVKQVLIYIDGEATTFGNNIVANNETSSDNLMNRLQMFSAFRVAPMLWYVPSDSPNRKRVVTSLNFYTTIEPKQLENMFNYYYLGLYNVEVKDVKSFQ